MLEHILHVFVRETEVKEAHCTLNLVFHLFFIETLYVSVQILHADFREINLRTLGFLNKYEGREWLLPFFGRWPYFKVFLN
jgi:hypothetical protein